MSENTISKILKNTDSDIDEDLFDELQTKVEEQPKVEEDKEWTPDKEVLDKLGEFNQQPITYSKEEIIVRNDELQNIADVEDAKSGNEVSMRMQTQIDVIEHTKTKLGIKHLAIPPDSPVGMLYNANIMTAAGDPNETVAEEKITAILQEIIAKYPEFIHTWLPGMELKKEIPVEQVKEEPIIEPTKEEVTVIPEEEKIIEAEPEGEVAKIIIDKSQAPEVSWSSEEIEKIKRSRSIELNIVEKLDVDYSHIEDVDDDKFEKVLSKYMRKVNDVIGVLPASKYRATFTGLTYSEVLDLNYSLQENKIDSLRKQWALVFNHIKNPSIGNFEAYKYFIDPKTKKKVKVDKVAPINQDVEIKEVSAFDDFLKKTSFMDLEFMLWKILEATSMNTELVQIDCKAKLPDESLCKNTYDWIYMPSDLVDVKSISAAVLEELNKTASASTVEEINENYKTSMLNYDNAITLKSSGITVVFGHISAYEYLNNIAGLIFGLRDKIEQEGENDFDFSDLVALDNLLIIKYFLIPKDGKYLRIKGHKGIKAIIDTLDEIDWQTIEELKKIMLTPYHFTYSLRDVKCPKCHNVTTIPINDIESLLFIVARNLSNVNVILKRS